MGRDPAHERAEPGGDQNDDGEGENTGDESELARGKQVADTVK